MQAMRDLASSFTVPDPMAPTWAYRKSLCNLKLEEMALNRWIGNPSLLVDRSNSDTWNDPRPIFWLDRSNRTHLMQLPGGREMYGAQPFGDSDQVAFEPGRAVILRQKGPPGEVELIEIESLGDTVWNRRFQLEPRRLTRQMIDQAGCRDDGHLQSTDATDARDKAPPGVRRRAVPARLSAVGRGAAPF